MCQPLVLSPYVTSLGTHCLVSRTRELDAHCVARLISPFPSRSRSLSGKFLKSQFEPVQNTSVNIRHLQQAMSFLIGLIALSNTFISAYALSQSLASISNVKVYEEKAERAADWSNSAKKRLWDTRYTIGTGLFSVSYWIPPRSTPRSSSGKKVVLI